MGNPEDQPERVWDEYQWERFLQQQDRKTEHYMELLEKYMDHPDRDQIIAREMGWNHLLDGAEEDWLEEADAQLASELGLDAPEAEAQGDDAGAGDFEMHPLYQAFSMTSAISRTTPPPSSSPPSRPSPAPSWPPPSAMTISTRSG
jgi:hypothetical protein